MKSRLTTAIWTAVVALLLAAAGSYLMYLAVAAGRSCLMRAPGALSVSKQVPYTLYAVGGLSFAGFAVALAFSIYNSVKYSDERKQTDQFQTLSNF